MTGTHWIEIVVTGTHCIEFVATGTHWIELATPPAGCMHREAFDDITKAKDVKFYKLKDLKFRSILYQEDLGEKAS